MARKLEHPGSTSEAQSAANKGVRRVAGPEMRIRSLLHRSGYRFRKDVYLKLADGEGRGVRPDIAFLKQKVAVFIDGCFWHGCPQHGRTPRSNQAYWRLKLEGNMARDRKTTQRLEAAGWTVIRVWEHEAPEAVAQRVRDAL